MKPINNFDKVVGIKNGYENLPAGGYICRIKKCTEIINRSGEGSHLEIIFDVAEGDYTNWFKKDWNEQGKNGYWHGIINQNIPDESSPKYDVQLRFFKRFINNIEESNYDYQWDWDETKLAGKMIGVVFGNEERESQSGTRYIITKAKEVTSVAAIREERYNIPKPVLLSPEPESYIGNLPDNDELPF